ncbi:hypothetical protein M3Y95_00045400 [Aphelenchoides besseyi]|nr:hypothetical protein M3Y95_00045400 [Aphelenchoides besseyi]
MNIRMSGLIFLLSFAFVVLCCCAANTEDTVANAGDDVVVRGYLQRMYENRPYIPPLHTSELFAKRAAVLPYSGGIYGKRAAALPFSGGIYGKRSQSDSMRDFLDHGNGINIRAMPMNGGFFG